MLLVPTWSANAQCFQDTDKCVLIQGRLSEDHVSTLKERIHDIDYVVINSRGGMAYYGRQIGIVLYNHNKPLYVIGECSSSCAEYILPGAPIVFAVNNPDFFLHGSTLINRNIAYERGFEISDTCPWNSIKWLNFIYEKRGLNPGFAQIQRWVTGDPKIDFEEHGEGCLRVMDFELPANSWNASELVLKYLWGLNIHKVELTKNG
mgnify:CR=1 FL=1